jgi:hypothetical protein
VARMVRKQIYIAPEQDALLKRRARELGLTESTLIRQGLEQVGRQPTVPPDEQAWEDELAFIRRRAGLPAVGGSRRWTREELYAERVDRVSR